MYANAMTFLAVILLWELFPITAAAKPLGWGEALAGTGVVIVLFFLLARHGFSRWERRGRYGNLDRAVFPIFHASVVQRYVFAAVAVYGFILYLFRWKTLCVGLLGEEGSQFLTSALGILPFGLLLVSVWVASDSRRKSWHGSEVSLRRHTLSQGKLFLPMLLPWLFILLAMDLLGVLSPSLQRRVAEDPVWGLVAFALLLLFLAVAFPGLVVRIWRCPPLPPGPVREGLEAFFARHGFRYARIVLWTIFGGSLSTAGILGIFPRCRYILITPSLLRTLDQEELEGVMAHEMGHAKHLHMAFYLGFMVGLTFLVDLSLRGVPRLFALGLLALETLGLPAVAWSLPADVDSVPLSLLFTIVFMIALIVLYFRYGFGAFSRNFERQSDLYALRIQGTAEHIVRSLEKISGFHPLVKVLPNWHHFSIQERIDFLRACDAEPDRIRRHNRKVRWMVMGYVVGLLCLGVVSLSWKTMQWDRAWALALQQRVGERLTESRPNDPSLWFAVGTIAYERGQLEKAEIALRQSIFLDPTNPEALNNLAWLYATAEAAQFRRPEEALRLADTAARLRPNVAHVLDTLAEAYFVNGRLAEALEMAKRAVELGRDRPEHYRKQVRRFQEALSRVP
jgi:Zn-dependent protease with chaperone function